MIFFYKFGHCRKRARYMLLVMNWQKITKIKIIDISVGHRIGIILYGGRTKTRFHFGSESEMVSTQYQKSVSDPVWSGKVCAKRPTPEGDINKRKYSGMRGNCAAPKAKWSQERVIAGASLDNFEIAGMRNQLQMH